MDEFEKDDGYGYDLKTVEKDSSLVCSICLLLLKEAMGTPCSHAFCRVCMKKLIGRDLSNRTFKCPECRNIVNIDKIYPSPFVDRLVRGSNVYCSQLTEGCGWIGTLGSFYQQHKQICDFQIIKCYHDGCKHSGMKRKMTEHQSECKHRIVECEFCQAAIKIAAMQNHHLSSDSIPTACPHDGCDIVIPKIKIQEHLELDCKFVLVDCTYAKFGCKVKVLRKDLDLHIEESTNKHMASMSVFLIQSQAQIKDLEAANEKMHEEVSQLVKANAEVPELQNEIDRLKTTNFELKHKVNKIGRRLTNLKKMKSRKVNKVAGKKAISLHAGFSVQRGIDKWIMKKDGTSIVGNYTTWYNKLSQKMIENRLYRFENAMFIKVKSGAKRKVYWSSNTKEEQNRIYFSGGVTVKDYKRGCSILDDADELSVETASLHRFKKSNSQAYALNSFDADKIISLDKGVTYDYQPFNFWCHAQLPDEFYFHDNLILCLIRI